MNLAARFRPSGLVVMRSPLLPFEEIEAWAEGLGSAAAALDSEVAEADLAAALDADEQRLRQRLVDLLARPEIREAVFLASPDLEESLSLWRQDPRSKKGQRAELALVRYFERMASRPTPFGLFSGCTPGKVGEELRLELAPRPSYRRHSRLDMDFLFALCEQLAHLPEARSELRYFANPTLTLIAGRYRFAEARLNGRVRTYHWVAVDAFPELEATLERSRLGAQARELGAALVASDAEGELSLEEAEAFVASLIDHQLLLPELSPQVTGEESTPALLAQLGRFSFAGAAEAALRRASEALAELDRRSPGGESGPYQEIAAELAPLGVPLELARLFQVDLIKPAAALSLDAGVASELLRGVELLELWAPAEPDGELERFCQAFDERYGAEREVPLLEVLDEEIGLGFGRSSLAMAEASPLLAGLPFEPASTDETTRWTRREVALLDLLSDALATAKMEVELPAEPPEQRRGRRPLPDAFQVVASLFGGADPGCGPELWLHHADGPSGVRMLGRFCHADPAIEEGVRAHLAAEERFLPEAVVAEIVHLPAGRIGNILARPVLREFEIAYLGRSGAPLEKQIGVEDLLVTVVGQRIVLRSRRLGVEVIPRLTTAHNTPRESLGIYRFLAALAGQGRQSGLFWSWGPLENAPFLPRVRSGRVVLARARWLVRSEELEPLRAGSRAEQWRRLQRWRDGRRLPRFACLADGDNELLIDFLNPLSVAAAFDLMRKRPFAQLVEPFPAADRLCVHGPEGRFVGQVVVPFERQAEGAPAPRPAEATPAAPRPWRQVARSFPPGSEWLYAKVYTGTATADALLCERLAPLAAEALDEGTARSWFFLRYSDPRWHLRVRFRGEPGRLCERLLPRLGELFSRWLAGGEAWRCELGTYEREVERYGGPEGIELVEGLFWHDSEATARLLGSLVGDAGAELRWRLTLLSMDRLLDEFGYELPQKAELAERMRQGIGTRYRTETLIEPLAQRLREQRGELEALLSARPATVAEAYRGGFEALALRRERQAPLVEELQSRERRGRLIRPLGEVVPSVVHMSVNRLCRSAGVEHELTLYDFLARLYRSQLARQGQRGGERRVREPERRPVQALA
ncbi:MAG: lantibiotic dehydratase [Thermoanaerobaculia bacterium]